MTALNIGDQLQILNGAQVPTDGVIIAGTASLNEAAISGESIPREKQTGDEVLVGPSTASQPLICGLPSQVMKQFC